MGRSRSFRQLGEKIDELESRLSRSTYEGVKEASLFTKRAVMLQLGSTGSPVVMSQVGRKATRDDQGRVIPGTARRGKHKVGVRFDIKKTSRNYTSLVRAFGNMHWLENGTQGHYIPKTRGQRAMLQRGDVRGLRRGGVGKTAAVTVKMTRGDGGYVRKVIWHPGARGTRPWSRGVAFASRHTPDIFANGMQDAVRKAFL